MKSEPFQVYVLAIQSNVLIGNLLCNSVGTLSVSQELLPLDYKLNMMLGLHTVLHQLSVT